MQLTPAIKGQLTKAIKQGKLDVSSDVNIDNCLDFAFGSKKTVMQRVINVFAKHMPREQAKHQARKYLAAK
jgi:hypothetical protein